MQQRAEVAGLSNSARQGKAAPLSRRRERDGKLSGLAGPPGRQHQHSGGLPEPGVSWLSMQLATPARHQLGHVCPSAPRRVWWSRTVRQIGRDPSIFTGEHSGPQVKRRHACQPLSCPAALLHSPSFLSACDPAHAHLIIIAVAAQKNLHPTMESPSRIGSPFLFFLPTETGIAQPGIGNGHETAVIFNGLAEGLKKKNRSFPCYY